MAEEYVFHNCTGKRIRLCDPRSGGGIWLDPGAEVKGRHWRGYVASKLLKPGPRPAPKRPAPPPKTPMPGTKVEVVSTPTAVPVKDPIATALAAPTTPPKVVVPPTELPKKTEKKEEKEEDSAVDLLADLMKEDKPEETPKKKKKHICDYKDPDSGEECGYEASSQRKLVLHKRTHSKS